MAKYVDSNSKHKYVDLLKYKWKIIGEKEYNYEDCSYRELLDNHAVVLSLIDCKLEKIILNANPSYSDYKHKLELRFSYGDNDILKMNPIAEYISYPAIDKNNTGNTIGEVHLNNAEKKMFTRLLQNAIGDKHSPKMQKVMINYYNAVDREIYNFVQDVVHERNVLPVTVGYLSEKQQSQIKRAIGSGINFAPRCVLDADTVIHILKRHGVNGEHDHCMQNYKDIARMSYVMANFDDVEYSGVHSDLYRCADNSSAPVVALKKRINGTYYIIEAVTDSKKKLCHILTAYIK